MIDFTPEFPSTKAMPYVYRGYNPTTGESYIGYHMQNQKKNIPSSSDLGVIYFTSSKIVIPRFHEFTWTIVAEFFESKDAYDFEQLLIFQSWKQPGALNKSCYHGKARFHNVGPATGKRAKGKPGYPHSDESKVKMSIAHMGIPKTGKSAKGVKKSDETKLKMSIAKKGVPMTGKRAKGKPGYPHSDESKVKMSIAKKGKPQLVIACPHCDKLGGATNMKRYHFDNCKFINN